MYIYIIVIHTQIGCEIDIRTLTSHQVLGQISDTFPTHFRHISDTFSTHFRHNQIFDQVFDDRKIQCTGLLGQKIQCTALLGQKKRLHSNYYCLFRAYPKSRLPANY